MRRMLLMAGFLLSLVTRAQDKKINNTTQLWSETDFIGAQTTKFKWQVDVQYARQGNYEKTDLLNYNSQFTVRPWLHYFPTPNLRISAFVGEWYNYAITEVGAREYPEYRFALQASYYQRNTLDVLQYRFRPEFRYIKDRQGAFEFVTRYRGMLKYQRLLQHTSYDKHALYMIALDEIFMNGTSKVTGYNVFDQNRVFAGLGYDITDNLTVETGYFNQYQHHAHDPNYDMNHVLQLSLIVDNIRFKRM